MLPRCRPLISRRAALTVAARYSFAATSVTKASSFGSRPIHATSVLFQELTPLRKELKDVGKAARAAERAGGRGLDHAVVDRDQVEGWELTVGIEIHAQLNTARKLFSGTLPLSARRLY